jgi:hypothetical protein
LNEKISAMGLRCRLYALISPGSGRKAIRELAATVFDLVDRQGAVLFKGTGLTSGESFSQVLAALGFRHASYVGGSSPRQDVAPGVYTATEIPSDITITLHQEKAYTDVVPDYISFFCAVPPENGQRTNLIGDMRRLGQRVPAAIRQKYQGKRARLRRCLPSRGGTTGDFRHKRCWEETFGTEDKQTALRIAKESGWDLRWFEDGLAELLQEPAPFYRTHPHYGEIFCPQSFVFHPASIINLSRRDGRISDAESLEQSWKNAPNSHDIALLEDGSSIPPEDALAVQALLYEEAAPYRLDQGEFIILDNLLMGPGRARYTGPRQIYVALGDRPPPGS